MLKLIAQNKYKLMAFMVVLYLLVDVMQHKGQARVLFPKNFKEPTGKVLSPASSSGLMNKDKNWKKGVNTKEILNKLNRDEPGFECDVYFDMATKYFNVHHDADKNTGLTLNALLDLYKQKSMYASIWLDIKNLNDSNAKHILSALSELRNRYYMQDRILVESRRADLLTAFSDSNFYTSFYIPFFNPYKLNDQQSQLWADSIASLIVGSKINALSGYYFQCSFLRHFFSQYPVLTWVDQSEFSIVNRLFQRKLAADSSIFIVLKP